MSEQLKKAQIYQEKRTERIPKMQRPDFHVSSPIGWINDPNGWSVYQGEYHLFFQYHPYSTHWGPMHWGHMKTKDFIKWERMPVAMAPDMQYDKEGCFSGSAIEVDGKHILMYTGVTEKHQVQCIAVGDGVTYKKIDNNPVITASMLPKGCNIHDFRDPKIWKANGKYYAIIGSKDKDNDGQVVLFQSLDLNNWEYVNSLDQSGHRYGAMWECPDLFELDNQDVLITSPQFMKAEGLEFHNGNGTICILGKVDEGRFIRKKIHAIDYGLDFYAPQTLKAADGRRIMIGWMQSWDNYITPAEFEWSGIMSIPRVLSIQNHRLYQYPVKEIEAYRKNRFKKNMSILAGESYQGLIKGRQIDLLLKIKKITKCSYFKIKLASGSGKYTYLTYKPGNQSIRFDRTYSGLCKDVQCIRKIKIDPFHEDMELRILMDKYTIELFIDQGKYVMSSLIYTELACADIDFETDGCVELSIDNYEIEA